MSEYTVFPVVFSFLDVPLHYWLHHRLYLITYVHYKHDITVYKVFKCFIYKCLMDRFFIYFTLLIYNS